MKRRILCFLLIALMAVSLLPISGMAAGSPRYTLSGKTVQAGDVFTVDVAIADNPGIISLRFRVVYDTSVLQLQGVANKGILNGYTTPAPTITSPYTLRWADSLATADNTVQGTVVTLTFKALKAASTGAVSIEHGEARNASGEKVTFAGASATVTVACSHSYGAWTNAGTEHQQVCSGCGDVKTAAHTWNSGTVTKQPTCKEQGEKTYTCTACNAKKTEVIAKTEDHSFNNPTSADGSSHKDTCSVCQKEITEAHSWDAGKVTKPASCKEAGAKTITCTKCRYSKSETIPKTTAHTYGTWQNADAGSHKHTCSVCQKEETAAHSWNTGVVTKKATCKEQGEKTYTCTGCGATRKEALPVSEAHTWSKWTKADANTHRRTCSVCAKEETENHGYRSSWSKDQNNHWHECSACGDKKDNTKHTPGAEATETTAQTCKACGYVIKAALGHKHSYAEEWTSDEAGHWYACSGCEEKGEYADHNFENACDPDCSVCGYTGQVSHSYAEAWESSEESHWQVCSGCGERAEEAAHVPGAEATVEAAQTCVTCGYELAPAVEAEPTEPATQAPTKPAPAKQEESSSFPWWIVIVAVVIIGGSAVVLTKRKK